LNLIVLIVFHKFLLPQTKTRSIFAPPTEKSFPPLCFARRRANKARRILRAHCEGSGRHRVQLA